MEIPKKFEPQEVEEKWYKYWMDNKLFKSVPDDREPYTVVIPPPNVTGVLHMGHMLNNTIQDVLVRRARMLGKNACWVPGTDHASIATEAKVVNKLREQGVKKSDLSRDEFLQHAWEWTHKHGGIILEQLKKLGASCDWDRTTFTMDKKYYQSVIDTFVDLYERGLIYRGLRMVNWDPEALTALSDEEVHHKEVNSKLYYVRYKIVGSDDEWITVATTRPETILGDTAVCFNPDDERYKHLIGRQIEVPIIGRTVPLITDEYVDPEFGTGCLKITPAHDINDYEIGVKHNLETIDVFNPNGTMKEDLGLYPGEDRFLVRKKFAKDLEVQGFLVKTEDHVNKVGYSERTDAVIEPRLSLQWFCSMKELAQPALDNVLNGNIKFHPSKFQNTYKHWMENIKDWCISRQLWWGHQIPAYFYSTGDDDFVVAKSQEEALEKAKQKSGNPNLQLTDLKQDEDAMDTWFSSWLWPISVFSGLDPDSDNAEIDYYYPTNDLVTAPEIMFFWVARMVMAGYEFKGELPFKNVYYTGIVRDKLGRKMSKSLGNSPNPLELINEYGADGVRVGMLLSSPAGNDLPFDSAQCIQGRNFTNKIWNAFRLVSSWEVSNIVQPESSKMGVSWLTAKLNIVLDSLNDSYDKFRISEALMTSYKFVWDDFCSWYLEIVKPAYQQPIDKVTYDQTIAFFEIIVKLLHPLVPFVSEEVWHLLRSDRKMEDCVMLSSWPEIGESDNSLVALFDSLMDIVAGVRTVRKDNNIAQKVPLEMNVKENQQLDRRFDSIITKLCNLSELKYVEEKVEGGVFSFVVKSNEYMIPFGESVDVESEITKLEKELEQKKGFLHSVMKKLSNERFVNNAPDQVVAIENKKKQDAETTIKVLEEKLASLAASQQ